MEKEITETKEINPNLPGFGMIDDNRRRIVLMVATGAHTCLHGELAQMRLLLLVSIFKARQIRVHLHSKFTAQINFPYHVIFQYIVFAALGYDDPIADNKRCRGYFQCIPYIVIGN